jgi:hypothetical protein
MPNSGSRERLVWEIRCVPCHRSSFAADVAENRLPGAGG